MSVEERVRGQLKAEADAFGRRRSEELSAMPVGVARRIRARQGLNVALAVSVAVSLAAGGIWGMRAVTDFRGDVRPTGQGVQGSNTVKVPPPGETRAVFLEDGRPAFVVRHADRTVTLADALSTHAPWGIHKLVWWCPSSRYFEDPFHGSTYDERGRYADGPAPGGLPRYEISRSPGDPGHVRVGDRLPAPGRTPRADPPSGTFCDESKETVSHEVAEDDIISVRRLSEAPDGWAAVEASLLVDLDTASLCDEGSAETCVDVPVVHDPRQRQWRTAEMLWLVRVSNGDIAELARVPS